MAVESPIDALSCYQLNPSNQLAVVSCGGCHVPDELVHQSYMRHQSFVVALDNDGAGERCWIKAWDDSADWTGFKISSDCPRCKDWNADRMAGFSFREYLELRHGMHLPLPALEDLAASHEKLAAEIGGVLRKRGLFVLEEFRRYLECGFYPYFTEFEDLASFQITLQQSVRATLESDLPALHPTLTGATIQRIRRLLGAIASNVPFTPDLVKLRRLLHIADDRTLKEYLGYLEDAGLILVLRRAGGKMRSMEKPDRIYLGDTSLACALAAPEKADIGTLRETFFARTVGVVHDVRAGQDADFLVNGRLHFEVGGKNKESAQIAGKSDAFLALDEIPAGSGRRIPLWLFGFLY